ncbi:hypothetical protein CDAR_543561 [Caerostris darwini]|uniref:Uncharacterized protein n=1 Tax=Caerostris darwini TaxID=1538125 RepID=A0AAV4V2V7_9ARAC|nr:hypothetical protein CDAR_543561 [Caerostris darwini]
MAMPSRNVAHSKAATLELPTIESGDYDIFLIQEPYLIEEQVAGLPLGWCTILEENGSALIATKRPSGEGSRPDCMHSHTRGRRCEYKQPSVGTGHPRPSETPGQKNMRVTVAQYGTPNADRMITKQEIR